MTRMQRAIADKRYRLQKDTQPPMMIADDGTVVDVWAYLPPGATHYELMFRPRTKQP